MNSAGQYGSELFTDCAKQAYERLVEIGCKVDQQAKPEEVVITYFAVKRRLICRRPRRVFTPQKLKVPVEHDDSFREIVHRAEAGEDLTVYQSRRLLLNPTKDDALLSDWDVQHLHFDRGTDPKNRSEKMLFARITDEALYCIDISDHQGFTRRVMLEILDRNWPESIARFLQRGIAGETLTDEDVRHIRSANANAFIRLPNGRTYGCIGGGRSCSGENALDIMACAQVFRECRDAANATAKDGVPRVCRLSPLR
jgi:hypothetical protein